MPQCQTSGATVTKVKSLLNKAQQSVRLAQLLEGVRPELGLGAWGVKLSALLDDPPDVPLCLVLGRGTAGHFDEGRNVLFQVGLPVVVRYHVPDYRGQRFLVLPDPAQQVLLLLGGNRVLLGVDHVLLLDESVELPYHRFIVVLWLVLVVEARPVHGLVAVGLLVEMRLGLGHLEVVGVLAGRLGQLAPLFLDPLQHLDSPLVVHHLLGDVEVQLAHPVHVLVDPGRLLLVRLGYLLQLPHPGQQVGSQLDPQLLHYQLVGLTLQDLLLLFGQIAGAPPHELPLELLIVRSADGPFL